jgi:hypothetical protein
VVALPLKYWSVRLQAAGFWPPQVKALGEGEAKPVAAGAAPAGEKKKRA